MRHDKGEPANRGRAVVWEILKALAAAARRDLAGWEAVKVNNFFLFVALLIYGALVSGVEPKSSYPFLLFLGFLLLFPLSSDPLDRIPPSRLATWPLIRQHRFTLRLASLALSPVLWLTLGIMLLASPVVAIAFLLLAVAIQGLIVLAGRLDLSAPGWNPARHIPQFPGNLSGMIHNHLREILSLLDTYLAALLSVSGASYRFLRTDADPSAFPILAMLVALAMSTSAQCLFGLDPPAAMARYKLLPLRGWQILLAKDIAFLVLLLILVAPLGAGPGMTFGLAALAIGHSPSVGSYRPQRRWRFTSGKIVFGVAQMVSGAMLGLAESQNGVVYLVGTAAAFCFSLFWCGRKFEELR